MGLKLKNFCFKLIGVVQITTPRNVKTSLRGKAYINQMIKIK